MKKIRSNEKIARVGKSKGVSTRFQNSDFKNVLTLGRKTYRARFLEIQKVGVQHERNR